jgi:hypothetical protein
MHYLVYVSYYWQFTKQVLFKKKYTALIKDQIPKDLTVFDLAYLKNGEQNLIQTV